MGYFFGSDLVLVLDWKRPDSLPSLPLSLAGLAVPESEGEDGPGLGTGSGDFRNGCGGGSDVRRDGDGTSQPMLLGGTLTRLDCCMARTFRGRWFGLCFCCLSAKIDISCHTAVKIRVTQQSR